jgi:hypothetical protein
MRSSSPAVSRSQRPTSREIVWTEACRLVYDDKLIDDKKTFLECFSNHNSFVTARKMINKIEFKLNKKEKRETNRKTFTKVVALVLTSNKRKILA